MQVNLYRFVRGLLPSFMREGKVPELIRVLLLQVEWARIQFNALVPDWMYRIHANGSVISLQHHIRRELDVDAVITPLDGQPTDFLVTVTGFVDENRLKALIDEYKIAGKSYVFRVGTVAYTAQYSGHVCEDIREVYTAAYSDYVCEDDRRVLLRGTAFYDTGDGWSVNVATLGAVNVASELTVRGVTYVYDGDTLHDTRNFIATIEVATNNVSLDLGGVFGSTYTVAVFINTITPASDSSYYYVSDNLI